MFLLGGSAKKTQREIFFVKILTNVGSAKKILMNEVRQLIYVIYSFY